MAIAVRLKRFLYTHRISYHLLYHSRVENLYQAIKELSLELTQCTITIGLLDNKSPLLAVIPANHQLNLPLLNRLLRRQYRVVSPASMDNWFDDCEPGSHSALGEPYRIPMIIDPALAKFQEIYLPSGCHTSLIKLSMEEFRYLTANQKWGVISTPPQLSASQSITHREKQSTPSSIEAAV